MIKAMWIVCLLSLIEIVATQALCLLPLRDFLRK